MKIWLSDKKTGIECGINSDGDLFFGSNTSGYYLRDTPENRQRIISDFCKYTSRQRPIIAANGDPIKFNGSMVEFSR